MALGETREEEGSCTRSLIPSQAKNKTIPSVYTAPKKAFIIFISSLCHRPFFKKTLISSLKYR